MYEKFIARNPDFIFLIWRPSEKLQLIAVKADPDIIGFIRYPTEAAQMVAIEADWTTIFKIATPCFKVQQYILLHHPGYIRGMRNGEEMTWDAKILTVYYANSNRRYRRRLSL